MLIKLENNIGQEDFAYLCSSIQSSVNFILVDRNGLTEKTDESFNSCFHEVKEGDTIKITVYKNNTTRQIGHATLKVVRSTREENTVRHGKYKGEKYYMYCTTLYLVEKTANIQFKYDNKYIDFCDELPTPPIEKKRYSIGQEVIVILDKEENQTAKGIIEDKCGDEYSVRTPYWRAKKWFKTEEISELPPVQEQAMEQQQTRQEELLPPDKKITEKLDMQKEMDKQQWRNAWNCYCNLHSYSSPQQDKMHCTNCGTMTLIAHLSDSGLCSSCCSEPDKTVLSIAMKDASSIVISHNDKYVWQVEVWKNGSIAGLRECGDYTPITVKGLEPLDKIEVCIIMGDGSMRTRQVSFLFLDGRLNKTENHLTVIPLNMQGSISVQWEYKIFPLSFEDWNVMGYSPMTLYKEAEKGLVPYDGIEITFRHHRSFYVMGFKVPVDKIETFLQIAPLSRTYTMFDGQKWVLPIMTKECYLVVDLTYKTLEQQFKMGRVSIPENMAVYEKWELAAKVIYAQSNKMLVLRCFTDELRSLNDTQLFLTHHVLPVDVKCKNF